MGFGESSKLNGGFFCLLFRIIGCGEIELYHIFSCSIAGIAYGDFCRDDAVFLVEGCDLL